MLLNNLRKRIFIPTIFNSKALVKENGNSKFFTKDLNLVKKESVETTTMASIKSSKSNELLDSSNDDYKYSPYLKPMDIKGIKRADRKYDYNSSYSFMKSQKDYNAHLVKPNIFVKYLYNGMKTPLPPKKYKISQYVDVRLDMFAPFIIAGIMSVPFFVFPCLQG